MKRKKKRGRASRAQRNETTSHLFSPRFQKQTTKQRIPGSEGACITSLAWVTVSSDEEDEEEEEHGGDDDDGDGEGGGGGGERAQRGAATGGGHHALPAPAQALKGSSNTR